MRKWLHGTGLPLGVFEQEQLEHAADLVVEGNFTRWDPRFSQVVERAAEWGEHAAQIYSESRLRNSSETGTCGGAGSYSRQRLFLIIAQAMWDVRPVALERRHGRFS